jgi:hypothetical protein
VTAGRLSQQMEALRRRVERPEALALSVLLSALAAYGWLAPPFWVAVTIAIQLALGGFGTVWLIGAAQPRLGYARYATPAVAAVSLTLAGRLVDAPLQLIALPLVIVLIFGVVWAELQVAAGRTPRLTVDLSLVGIVFAAAAGVAGLFPRLSWPPALVLVLVIAAIPAMRAAELRGRYGVEAVGQAGLHLLAIGQLGAVLALLPLPGVVGPAILALGFHAWAGAAEALDDGAGAWSVVIEFGSLALLGLLVALLLRGG